MTTVDNSQDTLNSKDIVARFDELQYAKDEIDELKEKSKDELLTEQEQLDLESWLEEFDEDEYEILQEVVAEGENTSNWVHGAILIHEDYFVEWTKQIIRDTCELQLPEQFNSGEWPWRHITIDYEEAAEELLLDYFDIDFDGVTYYIQD